MNANTVSPTPWELACHGGNPTYLTSLASLGADINWTDYSGSSGLVIASRKGDAPVTRALLALGANPDMTDKYGCSPLMHAVARGYHECVEALLASGVDPNNPHSHEATPVRQADTIGSIDTLRILARYGADFTLDRLGQGSPKVRWLSNPRLRNQIQHDVDHWFSPGAALAERESWLLSRAVPQCMNPTTTSTPRLRL